MIFILDSYYCTAIGITLIYCKIILVKINWLTHIHSVHIHTIII